MIDTQVFGFRYSSVLTPRRNAMPGHRVTTTALTTTVRRRRRPPATEKTTAARCQAGCGCKLSEVKGGGSGVFHKGKGRQLTPAIPPGNARAAVRGRVGQESHRRNRTSEARLTREARARTTSQPSNLKPDPSAHRRHAEDENAEHDESAAVRGRFRHPLDLRVLAGSRRARQRRRYWYALAHLHSAVACIRS